MNNLLILGAGGHGRVIAEAAEFLNKWDKISFLDDREDIKSINGFAIIGKLNEYHRYTSEYKYAFAAIGNNEKRLDLIDKLVRIGFDVPIIVHPMAYISKYSTIGEGSVLLPGAVVNTGTTIGRGCIVNINACVDHDCQIGDGVHISSGAVVRSMCRVEELSYIGAGSLVKEGSNVERGFKLPEGEIFNKK